MKKTSAIKILIEEHKTIQIVVRILEKLIQDVKNFKKLDLNFYNGIIDFFRTYVDECHHGKEEKILFRKLENKPLKKNENKVLNELLEEHKLGRKYISELDSLKKTKNDPKILELFKKMVSLYKMHIEKENAHFFYPAFEYFSKDEKNTILEEFKEFDERIEHEKYLQKANDLSKYLK